MLNAKIEPFGLVGHQSVGGMWSSANRVSLIQDPSNSLASLTDDSFPLLNDPGPFLTSILEQNFPGLLVPVEPANREDDTWAAIYSFDQYLWQPADDPTRGLGVFFHFGVADEDTNPIQYSYAMGIGGNGIVPGRPRDSFGIGWVRVEFSDNLISFVRKSLNLGLDHEDAIEMYYTFRSPTG